MSDYLERIHGQRLKDVADARAILDAAAADNRDMSPEEEERYDKFNTDIESRGKQLDKLSAAETRAQEAEAFRVPHQAVLAGGTEVRMEREFREELRSIGTELRGDGHWIEARYSEAFQENLENRALITTGDTVPVNFADFVAVYQRTLNPTYNVATVIPSSNGQNLTIPRVTADSTAFTPGEGTAITPSDPTISSVTLSVVAYKGLAYVSQELVEDEAVGLQGIITRSAARAIGLDAGTAFTTGSGGFITLGQSGATASGTPFFDADDLISLFYSRAQPYRESPSAVWMMSNAALQKVRKLKTTVGEYLWEPSLQIGQPDSILSRRVYENPAMASVASATKAVAFGDFSAYIIKEVVPMRVAASADFLFNTDQVAYKVVWRAGGTLPDVAAIAYLVSGNS